MFKSNTPEPISLTSQARSALRGAAHPLKPVVLIGDQGLTEAVIKEINLALNAHELIKVRAGSQERDERESFLQSIVERLGAAAVHHLGKTLIIYRPSPKGLYASQAGLVLPESAKRKTREPHIPKKLAAAGKKRASKSTRAPKSNPKQPAKSTPFGVRAFSAESGSESRDVRGVRGATTRRPTAAGKPRASKTTRTPTKRATTRSALSLRAGVRGRGR